MPSAEPRNRLRRAVALLVMLSAAASTLDRPIHVATEGGDETGPAGADDWFHAQRAGPDGKVHVESRAAAIAEMRRLRETARGSPYQTLANLLWEPLGPSNIGGRVTDVVGSGGADPVTYVAAASGGVWKLSSGAPSWTPVFDGNGTLAVGALAMPPGNADVVYVGTGEANPGGGSLAYDGNGVWKTTDGGGTWTHQGLDATGSVGRLAVDPARPERVFAATMGSLFSPNPDRGLFRSVNGGATWEQVLFLNDSTGCVDVAIDPSNTDRVFAVAWERIRRAHTRRYGGPSSGIFRSLDGGDTWTRLAGGLPEPPTSIGRIGIAVAPSSPQNVYAYYGDAAGFFHGFYRSTNGGNSWTLMPRDSLLANDSSFSWWFGRVWVDPAHPLNVWNAGLSLFRSLDGGQTWSVSSGLHVDHHAMWIDPASPSDVWEGNDGGTYRSTVGGGSWVHEDGQAFTQLYTIEVHPSEPLKVYGGAQDNHVLRTSGGPALWSPLIGGDGQYVVVDPSNTGVIYAETQNGALRRSTNGGASFVSATAGISPADRKNWSTPVVADPLGPAYPNTRLYYGANRVYRTTNAATSWTAVSPDLTDGAGGSGGVTFGTVTSIAVSPVDSTTVYAGTDDGNVWVSTDYAATWQPRESGLPKRWVTRVVAHPTDPAVAFVTFSGLRWDEPLAHVFRTTDRGLTWTDIGGGLPDVPVNDLAVDTQDASVLYVATDIGVFATSSGGAIWAPLGTGLPEAVVVTDLKLINAPGPMLYAATYGRSAFRLDVSSKPLSVARDLGGRTVELGPARPNPWSGSTTLELTLPAAEQVRASVLDAQGRRVATILDQRLPPGRHPLRWDGRDRHGRAVPAGAYFVRIEAGGRSITRRTTRLG